MVSELAGKDSVPRLLRLKLKRQAGAARLCCNRNNKPKTETLSETPRVFLVLLQRQFHDNSEFLSFLWWL